MATRPNSWGPSTRSVHDGEKRRKLGKSLTTPVTLTSTFVFEDLEEYEAYKEGSTDNYEYGRYGNPTQRTAEEKVAALEGGEDALLFPNGMSAITSLLQTMLRSGQHLITVEDCYRMTQRYGGVLARYGIEVTLVKTGDMEALAQAVRPETRVLFAESPSNLHLRVSDLRELADFSSAHGIRLVVDSTLATPINQRPLELGADLVVHSATKYLAGHNDLLAGSVCGAGPMVDAIREFRNVAGPTPDPLTCYQLIRGLKTLALRMARHNDTGQRIAQYLEDHPKVSRVHYPGLPTHPDHDVAVAQMRGFGGLLSFEIDSDAAGARRFIHSLTIPYLAPSFGGVESLVSQPATVSYYDLSPEDRQAIGVPDELVRFAAGIEDTADLIADLEQALAQV